MSAFLSAAIFAFIYVFFQTALIVVLEAIQSMVNGFGFVQGFIGGFGLVIARIFSVQYAFCLVCAALLMLLFLVKALGFKSTVFALAVVPVAALAVHYQIRGIGMNEFFDGFRFRLGDDGFYGVSLHLLLLISGLVAAWSVVRMAGRCR